MSDTITVLGGGVAGLVLARRLALAGCTVAVREKSDRFGGQVAPQQIAGVRLDAAAESFATRGGVAVGTVRGLLKELGLDGDVVLPRLAPAWLVGADGTAVALPATSILGIPADPMAADVVAVLGEDAARRAAQDSELPADVGAGARTLGELVRARMGDGVVEALVAPVVRGVHSVSPDELVLDAASPALRAELARTGSLMAAVRRLRADAPAGSQVAGISGGMFRLVDALVADCERLGVDLSPGASHESVSGIRVRAFGVSDAPRQVSLVTLVVRAPELDAAPRGTGVLVTGNVAGGSNELGGNEVVGTGAGVSARALTHLSAKWQWVADALPGRHAVRLSYDGALTGDSMAHARADAEKILGARIDHVEDATVITWRRHGHPGGPAGASGGNSAAPRSATARDSAGNGMVLGGAGSAGDTDRIWAVGESVAGTGLAAVIAHAERTAAAIAAAVA